MKKLILIIAVFVLMAFGSYTAYIWPRQYEDPDRPSKIATRDEIKEARKIANAVRSLHRKMGPVRSGDWLEQHRETGQTFKYYLRSYPVTLTKERNKLYVQPIGEFKGRKQEIIELAAEFMEIYFACEVVINKSMTSNDFPDYAQRVHPSTRDEQLLTTYILDEVLRPKLPDDAFAIIAFTEKDLWPGKGWNFVFGQASLQNRVGVWSIHRNGDPEDDFAQCLRRTVKVATHETGHMFSIKHCIAFQCNMNGANSLREGDRQPLHLCAECLPKILVATKAKAKDRFKKLAEFCKEHDLGKAADYYEAALKKLGKN